MYTIIIIIVIICEIFIFMTSIEWGQSERNQGKKSNKFSEDTALENNWATYNDDTAGNFYIKQ